MVFLYDRWYSSADNFAATRARLRHEKLCDTSFSGRVLPMHWRAITRLFGILLVLYSVSFLPSLVVALLYRDGQWGIFLASALACVAAGLQLWLPNLHQRQELSIRDGFLVVTLFWVILGVWVPCRSYSGCILVSPMRYSNPCPGLPLPGPRSSSASRLASIHSLSPPADTVARRYGHYRTGDRNLATAGRRRHAAVPCRGIGCRQA